MNASFNHQQGFTLFEVLIVIALFGMFATLAVFIGFDVYKGYSFRGEQYNLVGILQKARNQAVNNINQTTHGVHITANYYSLFEGSTYTSGIDFPVSAGFTPSGATDVVFSQLTGNTVATSITLTENNTGKTLTIHINNEGQINY